jgi:hypothetical protein
MNTGVSILDAKAVRNERMVIFLVDDPQLVRPAACCNAWKTNEVLRIGAVVSERYGMNIRANRAEKATKLHRSKDGTITISLAEECGGKKALAGRAASASFLQKRSKKLLFVRL